MEVERSEKDKAKILAHRIHQARLAIMGFRAKRASSVMPGRTRRGKSQNGKSVAQLRSVAKGRPGMSVRGRRGRGRGRGRSAG